MKSHYHMIYKAYAFLLGASHLDGDLDGIREVGHGGRRDVYCSVVLKRQRQHRARPEGRLRVRHVLCAGVTFVGQVTLDAKLTI